MNPNKQKASKHRIRNREQTEKALRLRTAGASYSAIGEALGLSKTRAYDLVMAGLAEANEKVSEAAMEAKAVELARLDAIVLSHFPNRNQPRSAEILLKASKRRSEILGLDAPAKIAPTTPDGLEPLPTEIRIVRVKPDGGA